MTNKFKKIMLFSIFSLVIAGPTPVFAWHGYASYGDWDYHGSGRDQPYSAYIDRANYVGYADYTLAAPDYIDEAPYVRQIAVAPAVQQNEFTINVPNSRGGGYTSVIIKRSGSGFVGPQGEYYPDFPRVFQLKLMYAK